MRNRDALGRFTRGNTVAALGWHGLVRRRFQGNELAAKDWLGQLGRWSYGLNYFNRSTGQYAPWVKQPFRQQKPGVIANNAQVCCGMALSGKPAAIVAGRQYYEINVRKRHCISCVVPPK